MEDISRLGDSMRQPFEESVGATLGLNLTRTQWGTYASPKTGELFIAFCYGWKRGEGDTKSLAALLRQLADNRREFRERLGLEKAKDKDQ